jgi:hypothetical protein
MSKTQLIRWLIHHLPRGPEAHLDNLPRILASLGAQPIEFLRDLKKAREKDEARDR